MDNVCLDNVEIAFNRTIVELKQLVGAWSAIS